MIIFLSIIGLVAVGLYLYTRPVHHPYATDKGDLDFAIDEKYTIQTLQCKDDYEGEVVATLVKHPPLDSTKKAVLYIHGYIDYFFHDHVAQWYVNQGYNFYALDLRKNGRSWLPHQRPCMVKNFNEYFEEIDMALDIIQDEGHDFIIMNGHSNGGLITSIYLEEGKNKNKVNAAFLNAPFLQWPYDWAFTNVIKIVSRLGAIRPYGVAPDQPNPIYFESLHAEAKGKWDYNLGWKPFYGFPKYLAWLKAVTDAQNKVTRGLNIKQPILVMASDKTYKKTEFTPDIMKGDAILYVEHIKKYAPSLGENVTYEEVPNAIHDLFLSTPEVIEDTSGRLEKWLRQIEK